MTYLPLLVEITPIHSIPKICPQITTNFVIFVSDSVESDVILGCYYFVYTYFLADEMGDRRADMGVIKIVYFLVKTIHRVSSPSA